VRKLSRIRRRIHLRDGFRKPDTHSRINSLYTGLRINGFHAQTRIRRAGCQIWSEARACRAKSYASHVSLPTGRRQSWRLGRFELDGRTFDFRMRGYVPSKLSEEFLLVDLLHHLDRLPENKAAVLPKALRRAERVDRTRLARCPGSWVGPGAAAASACPCRTAWGRDVMRLHQLPGFSYLIAVATRNERIDPGLVEKDAGSCIVQARA